MKIIIIIHTYDKILLFISNGKADSILNVFPSKTINDYEKLWLTQFTQCQRNTAGLQKAQTNNI